VRHADKADNSLAGKEMHPSAIHLTVQIAVGSFGPDRAGGSAAPTNECEAI
jgi:hypothetical protein